MLDAKDWGESQSDGSVDGSLTDKRICGRVTATQFINIARSFAFLSLLSALFLSSAVSFSLGIMNHYKSCNVVMTTVVIIFILFTKLLPLNSLNQHYHQSA